jgi:small subunit ribosomal protein S9
MAVQYFEGIGRRKESSARVRVMSGEGKFIVNDKEAANFFTRAGDIENILRPFTVIGQERGTYDITVLVNGGGVTGQTSAVTLGLTRALVKLNNEWNSAMRKAGLLTRDARIKERKKPGLKRARKAPTYTKR